MRHRQILALLTLAFACGEDPSPVTDGATSTGAGTSTGGTSTGAPTTDPPPTSTDVGAEESATGSTSTGEPTTSGTSTSGTSGTSGTTGAVVDDTSTGGDTSTGDDTSSGSTTGTSSGSTTGASGSSESSGTSSGDDTSDTGSSSDTGEDTGEPVEQFGFVGFSANDSLSRFELQTELPVGAPVSLLPEGDYPYDAVIKPDGSEVWVVGAVGDGIKVLDPGTGEIIESVDLTGVGEYPVDVLFLLDGRAMVSSRDSKTVVYVDPETYAVAGVVALVPPQWGGKGALDPCTGHVHMVDWYDSNLIRVDPQSNMVTSKPLGDSLWDVRVDPAGERLYVTDRGLDAVHVLDTATLTLQTSVAVGVDPWALDITSDGELLVVTCEDDESVHFIETAGLTTSSLVLPADSDPRDVDISADDARAYVTTGDVPGQDGVHVIDLATRTLLGTIALSPNGNSNIVAVTPQSVTCAP